MSTSWQPPLPPALEYKKQSLKELSSTAGFIYQAGESDALREPCQAVDVAKISSKEFQQKVAYLRSCLEKYRKITGKGRGIAAVQVGVSEQFFIFYRKEARRGSYITIINPRITKKSKDKYSYPEMCMSCNGLVASVVRPAWVEFNYYDEKGTKRLWRIKNGTEQGKMENRIALHEIDHQNGILNIDRVKSSELVFEKAKDFYVNASFTKTS